MKLHRREFEFLFIEVCKIFLCHCFDAYWKEIYVSAYTVLGYINQIVVKSINHIHVCTHNLCSYYSSGRKPHPFIQEKTHFHSSVKIFRYYGAIHTCSNDKESWHATIAIGLHMLFLSPAKMFLHMCKLLNSLIHWSPPLLHMKMCNA